MSALDYLRKYFAALALVFSVLIMSLVAWAGGAPEINEAFGMVVTGLEFVLMLEIPLIRMPLVVAVLFFGALFFTFRFRFINFRGFAHGVLVLLGKYDDPDDPGDVSHLQALSSALSATVGLGNIAGVAIAVSLGGPGAVFWMMLVALFGMSSKFAESTLGQMYRQTDSHGEMRGGPMVYLREGLDDMRIGGVNLGGLGAVLSVLFAILCIGTSLGAGNMFQTNQSFKALSQQISWLAGERADGEVRLTTSDPREIDKAPHQIRFVAEPDGQEQTYNFQPTDDLAVSPSDWSRSDGAHSVTLPVRAKSSGERYNLRQGAIDRVQIAELGPNEREIANWNDLSGVEVTNPEATKGGVNHRGWVYGIGLVLLVGLVIIGGIKSIARVAEKIVPAMCALYIVSGLAVIYMNIGELGSAVQTILQMAFNPESAGWGGLMGVFVQGVRRAAFSSEAGIGSAPIAHSAAKTDEPVREGLVAMLGPFIDTIIVCFVTGMVIVISGVWEQPETAGLAGVQLTAAAFGDELWWFPWVLSFAVSLFAFSTMISWSYYGERCWTYLFGDEQAMAYRYLFLFFILLGSISTLEHVLGFGDYFLLAMAFPNILGVVLLSGEIDEQLRDYWERYQNGEFE